MKNDNWRRRSALHLAAQLPDNPDDALKVLEYAQEIVRKFLSTDAIQSTRRLSLVKSAASTSSSRRARPTDKVSVLPE